MDVLAKRVWRDICLVIAGTAGVVAAIIFALHLAWFTISPDWSVCMDARIPISRSSHRCIMAPIDTPHGDLAISIPSRVGARRSLANPEASGCERTWGADRLNGRRVR
jgi:hypothetical protein